MTIPDRTTQRVAEHVHQQLAQLHEVQQRQLVAQTRDSSRMLSRLPALSRKLEKATARRWDGAAHRLREQLQRAQREAEAELGALDRALQWPGHQRPTRRTLIEALQQIEDEFGGWRYDRRDAALCCTTEPIELEGIALGRFELRLRIDELPALPRQPPYDVIALEPHPAASSPQVTHPHVADERLCEGEATPAIRSALGDGRLCEFFLLIRSVLTHYNAGSPYVPLEQWTGEPCAECGDVLDAEERGYCDRCDVLLCRECGECCAGCRHLYCPGCLLRCAHCDELICSDCVVRCVACGRHGCTECLSEDEPCTDCLDQQAREEPKDHDHEASEQQDPRQSPAPVTP